MPVRKRRNRRRPEASANEWFCAFESEFDLFGDLSGLVDMDPYGRPDREAARAAWRLHGDAFLADFDARYPRGAHFTPWAVLEFGNPR
jgi:hypothetical protein